MGNLPRRNVAISLIAENRYAASEPATLHLRWRKQQFVIKPKLYVLAIGVSDYDNNRLDLDYAAQDAQDFVNVLKKPRSLYRDIKVQLLTDADKDTILDGLEWIERQVTQHDVAMVFFAGHGINAPDGRYFSFPRFAAECRFFAPQTANLLNIQCRTQSVRACIPTQSVGTRKSWWVSLRSTHPTISLNSLQPTSSNLRAPQVNAIINIS